MHALHPTAALALYAACPLSESILSNVACKQRTRLGALDDTCRRYTTHDARRTTHVNPESSTYYGTSYP
ncbi:hypothetical protein GMOD_00001606 [Pyrenophora seminiperda CCB06]|uniref:Uncharacterized protein n=1 Tax=Pyrenophora seminiperda CCB06 TaxID=1302712 RepID=A0A3M7LZP7_9PLEO|nr:hypothetical protein GMOD_00001606 [Pyrenophora seminiperda CCB06]